MKTLKQYLKEKIDLCAQDYGISKKEIENDECQLALWRENWKTEALNSGSINKDILKSFSNQTQNYVKKINREKLYKVMS